MASYRQRGLTDKQDQFHSQVIRDTRPFWVRTTDALKNPRVSGSFLFLLGFAGFVASSFWDIILVLGIIVYIYVWNLKVSLPFRMPQRSGLPDYNDMKPDGKTPNTARGIYFFGNEIASNEELWFNNDDMRTHVLIFGSTGSGKTEALVSLSYNALLQASGFIYVDGKGDNSLFAKVFSMVRSMGREDDILLINYMTGARDVIGPQSKRLSNTMNPFANGSSSMLSQLVVSLMDGSSKGGDGDMWKGRAIGFVEALMRVLVTMRDAGYILLDANTIRNYFLLPKLEAMAVDRLFLRDDDEPVNLENFPRSVLEPIENYVLNLPGYTKDKKGKQVSQVLEQHGYITMQLTRTFTSLADTYGHIMRTNLAEVDLKDVVLNRRILCVLLPALEKSPDELSNLGKVIIASLKSMMAAGLGDSVEGDLANVIEAKPTNSKTPYLCILDEYGYYAVEGFAVVPAQARSLGFSVVFAGQDLPAFQKASKEEAASIGANTNIKICMKLEDPTETWDFFNKTAGESYVTHVDNFQIDQNSLFGMYQDGKGARAEKRSRVDLLDLKEQKPGEAHIFFRSKIVRGRFFYASPKLVKRMRLNHFLKIEPPTDMEVRQWTNAFSSFMDRVASGVTFLPESAAGEEELVALLGSLSEQPSYTPVDVMSVALQKQVRKNDLSDFFHDMMETVETEGFHIFAPFQGDAAFESLLTISNPNFKKPLLNRADIRDHFEYVERLSGRTGQQAINVALELTADLERVTKYPPEASNLPSGDEFAARIHKIVTTIQAKAAAA